MTTDMNANDFEIILAAFGNDFEDDFGMISGAFGDYFGICFEGLMVVFFQTKTNL